MRRNRLDAACTRQLVELGGPVQKAGLVPEYDCADELLDIESYATFDIHTLRFYPASKAELFQAFVEPVELLDGSQHVRTLEEAETALRYPVKKKMVVVDGDLVSAHPRFAYLADASKQDSSQGAG